ncbi:macrophage mannose receptor 1-like [Paramacrobiotus metropolitanus]|uniref:macrophage mannose receptor 1-like n=1 Tax=Paramacrobiotus metropolitanus TaxID=2943436 RepID=UPI002445B9AD|nr:macrophage mannose receptor 1-like [Paramacrobiotus metropolitanus]
MKTLIKVVALGLIWMRGAECDIRSASKIDIPHPDGCDPWGVRFNSSCFYFGDNPSDGSEWVPRPYHNFDNARQFCQTKFTNADLATIGSMQEQQLMSNVISRIGAEFWIGLRENSDPWTAFNYWVDGSRVKVSNWGYGQPAISPSVVNSCVGLRGSYGKEHLPGDWFVDNCSVRRYALCRAPVSDRVTTTSRPQPTYTTPQPPTTDPAYIDTTSTWPSAGPVSPVDVPSYLLEPLNISRSLGRMQFPEGDLDLMDSLTTVFDGDNTLDCRVILHDQHSWILAKAGEARQKRSSYYEPITVQCTCTRGNLTVSSLDPGNSESIGLVFRSGGSKKCMETYREFLTYLNGFYKV